MPARFLRRPACVLAVAIAAIVWFVAAPARAAEGFDSGGPMRSVVTVSLVSAMPAAAPVLATLVPPAPPPVAPPSTMAPLCDPRGAITFAPPPQMQDVETSIDTSLTPEDCLGAWASSESAHRAAPGRAPPSILDTSPFPDATVAPVVPALGPLNRELVPAPAASRSPSRPGFHSTVDRPPRV